MSIVSESSEKKIIEKVVDHTISRQAIVPNAKLLEKRKKALSKKTINILRTTLRNNIDLTQLADSKANVLLSLNAIMLTFLLPFSIPYIDLITTYRLVIPLLLLVATCLITVYLSVSVLKPGKFDGQKVDVTERHKLSPFFFGNFEKMTKDEFLEYSDQVLSDDNLVKSFLSNDFYHIGLRLGEKMRVMRRAFNIFIFGLAVSILLSIILIITSA